MRHPWFVIALALCAPGVAEAQARLLVGGGITSPSGSLADVVDTGYHVRAALQVGIPTLPLSIQADGAYHSMSATTAAVEATKVLVGALSLVYTLPGVGLSPYLLSGVGKYRVDSGPVGMSDAVTDTGYHAGFGVAFGSLGLGGFVEIRYVRINGDPSTKMIPVTVGLRF